MNFKTYSLTSNKSDINNYNKKILSSGHTKEEAQREVDRRSAEASKK